MNQAIEQPATHSLLRNSQTRRQSSHIQQHHIPQHNQIINNHSQYSSHNQHQSNKQLKYHFNYQPLSQSNHTKRINSLYLSNQNTTLNSNNIQNNINGMRNSMIIPSSQQKIVVCSSVPKHKPKYSFTFNQSNIKQSNIKISNNKHTTNNINQLSKKKNQTPRASLINQQKNQSQRQQIPQSQRQHISQFNSGRKSNRSGNVRKDMDLCLYAITDKLRQLQQKQCDTMNFIQSKFNVNVNGTNNEQQLQGNQQQQENIRKQPMSVYKPSISQIRKNKKLFLDRSIHRIHPQIVNQYIETIYREYDIPNPLLYSQQKQRQNSNNNMKRQNEININSFMQKQLEKQIKKQKQIQKEKQIIRQKQIKLNNKQYPSKQQQQQKSIQSRLLTMNNKSQQQYFLYNSKDNNNNVIKRKNNLINQKSKQNKQKQNKQFKQLKQNKQVKQRKKKYLNLTLSKQKHIQPKTFQSPSKHNTTNKKDNKQKSQNSKSSKSKQIKQSNSQRKILQIKHNISTWNDNQHQYAERYSYIQSPYQMIKNKTHQQYQIRPSLNQQHSIRPSLDSDRQINIKIRPFQQLMKVTAPTQSNQPYSRAHNTNMNITQNTTMNLTQSQVQSSKYVQSMFMQQGQVRQQFRYCILCQLPVLSANIFKHEQKCIGWISQMGRLYTFKQLYKFENEQELKQLIKGKIKQIKKRLINRIQILKQRQKNDLSYSNQLGKNIIKSVSQFVQSYIMMTDFDLQNNKKNKQVFDKNYKKIQKNYKNEYLMLLQQSRKLHWFIKLLQNYQYRINYITKNKQIIKYNKYHTTQTKHNQSLTFVQQQYQQHISQFIPLQSNNNH